MSQDEVGVDVHRSSLTLTWCVLDLILGVGVEVRYLCVGLDARSTHSLLSVTLPCNAALAVRIRRLGSAPDL